MRFSYCFFDLDGTLTQSEYGVFDALRPALAHFGVAQSDDAFLRQFIGPPLSHSFRHFAGLDDEATEEAIGIFRARYNTEGYKKMPLYAGIPDAAARLRSEGRCLAVVTSKPESIAWAVFENLDLGRWFDNLFGADDSEADVGKEILIGRALVHYGLAERKEEAVMIGDRRYDILGAKKAGIASAGVLYGYGDREELTAAGADVLAETPADIPEVLR